MLSFSRLHYVTSTVMVVETVAEGWTQTESEIAKRAFDLAYERELSSLISILQQRISNISTPEDIWNLHDFLSSKRYEIDGKYDFRYSSLVFVFSSLIKCGLLHLDELKGLDADKLSKIAALSRM